MPIYTEGTQPYNAPLSSPVGLEPYGEILALRKMMENGESALHDAEQAASTVGAAVTAANQAASDANSAASSARSAAAVANEKASAADTAATQASDAAGNALSAAAMATTKGNQADAAAQSANTAATAAGSAASDARQAASSATQAATAANRAVATAQAATGQASDALTAANAANATATASIALAESAASDASTAAADARSATANAITATSHANVATANANAAADAANRAANVAAVAANNANAKAADARHAADLANTAAAAANRATSDASGAADDANAAATAANSAATAANSATTAANSAATAANSAATAASSAATTASEAAITANAAATTANAAAGNANAAANRVDTAISDANAAAAAASAAATDAEDRIEAAIEAVGDISELAVPLMSADTRGGAKLGDGLAVDDGTLHVGQLTKESTGEVYGPLASVTAKGWAEQDSTTGKNLLDFYARSSEANDVTLVVDSRGIGKMSGTPSATTYFALMGAGHSMTLPAGTYVLSISGTGTLPKLRLGSSTLYDDSVAVTFDESTTIDINTMANVVAISGTAYNCEFVLQLELGSTATEYEPYTGGAPSPSPDYPQEIRVAMGRNLIDESTASAGYLNSANGEFNASTSSITTDFIEVSPQSSYTLVVLSSSSIKSSNSRAICCYDKNKSYINNYKEFASVTTAITIPFTTTASTKFVRITYDASKIGAIQFTEGSTPQPYVPYGHVGLEVQGKNLFDELNEVWTEKKVIGSTGSEATVNSSKHTNNYTPVSQGNYTISFDKTGTENSGSTIAMYDSSKTFVERVSAISNTTETGRLSGSFEVSSSIAYVLLNTALTATNVQLEKGATATAYQPYFASTTPIPLPERGWVGGLPDGTSDVLSIDSAGKVEWELDTSDVVLDGSEVWRQYSAGEDSDRFSILLSDTDIVKPTKNVNMVTHGVPSFSTKATWGHMDIRSTGWIVFNNNDHVMDGIPSLVTWLQQNNVTFLYPITPVTEHCGYVDLPDIPSEATVSIPELEELSLTFWVDGDGTIRAAMREWYERAHSEYADRLTALEEAVAEIVAG